jgi:hypothetical protein
MNCFSPAVLVEELDYISFHQVRQSLLYFLVIIHLILPFVQVMDAEVPPTPRQTLLEEKRGRSSLIVILAA